MPRLNVCTLKRTGHGHGSRGGAPMPFHKMGLYRHCVQSIFHANRRALRPAHQRGMEQSALGLNGALYFFEGGSSC
jgi:hypothetical protein